MSEQTRSKLLGDFGEYLLAWFLRSKFAIETSLVKSEGIDILCRDNKGVLLPEKAIVAISVRTRERNDSNSRKPVDADWSAMEKASDAWGAIAYFAHVLVYPKDGSITLFLLPVSKARSYGKEFSVVKAEKESSNIILKSKFEPY